MTKSQKVIRAMRASLRLRGRLKRYAFLGPGVSLNIASSAICKFGDRTSIGRGCGIAVGDGARLIIGDHTDIQANTRINASTEVEIGNYCAISWHVDILDDDFHMVVPMGAEGGIRRERISIGDRVWIGTGAKILKGVTIGEDSVVAAGAVVNKTFPPRSLIGGVPARRITEIAGWR